MKIHRRLRSPLRSARALVANRRSAASDLVLATVLAGIAGAANAGGFFALGQYTSHMTGYLSQLADNIVNKPVGDFRSGVKRTESDVGSCIRLPCLSVTVKLRI